MNNVIAICILSDDAISCSGSDCPMFDKCYPKQTKETVCSDCGQYESECKCPKEELEVEKIRDDFNTTKK